MEAINPSTKFAPARAKAKHKEEIQSVRFGIAVSLLWVLGIAFLAWMDWWWPGVMVLTAITILMAGFFAVYYMNLEAAHRVADEESALVQTRAQVLPDRCTACGAPITASNVVWHTPVTASCPYCDTPARTKA